MLFISPPFGNYINLPGTTSIKGSFTAEKRDGLLLQVIKTLRYSIFYEGWINKIGLRNPGIKSIKDFSQDNIYSIAIMSEDDIDIFNNTIPKKANIEINISCPNVSNKLMYKNINKFINSERKWCCVKLSPSTDSQQIDELYNMGFRKFHLCNTLHSEKGGISGKILRPHVVKHLEYIKNTYKDCEVITGGGITNINDIIYYKDKGADHFSISTVIFNPFMFGMLYFDYLDYSNKL